MVMKVWVIVLLFINATSTFAAEVSAISVRETTRYSAEIELVDKEHHLFISFVKCNGTQTYTTEYRTVQTEKSQVKENFPDGNSRAWISSLIPNCNYTCVVVQKNSADHKSLSLVTFSTKYDTPLPPPAPEVTTETSNRQLVVTILLFASSTKPSPISGYKLQFYVVEVDADGKPLFSQNKMLELIPSLEEARNSKTATDFLYQTYDVASLPDTVIIQPTVFLGAFKHNYTYSAVLSSYRNESEGYEQEYATSEPSAAFKIIHSSEIDKYNFRAKYARNVAGIVLGGVVPVLLCLSAIALLTVWCKYRKKKTTNARFQKKYQDKFKYPVFDASSRKSLFSIKSPSPQYQPKKNVIPNRPVGQPKNKIPNAIMDKGLDMFRRTSVTLTNAFNNFTHSLKRYSWISDVDDLIIKEGEKVNDNEFDKFTKDAEDPLGNVDAKVADDSSNIQNSASFEDPERVMGSVITLSSTPVNAVSGNQQELINLTPEPLQEAEPLRVVIAELLEV